jgi:hypothetical protein
MSLQTKLLDFTQASFSNGALLDVDGKIKSEALLKIGSNTASSTDGLFNATYGSMCSAGGYLFVSEYSNGRVQKLDLDGNFVAKLSLSDVMGITTDGAYLYISSYSAKKIYKYDLDFNYIGEFATDSSYAGVLMCYYYNNEVYIASYNDDDLRKINADFSGAETLVVSGAGFYIETMLIYDAKIYLFGNHGGKIYDLNGNLLVDFYGGYSGFTDESGYWSSGGSNFYDSKIYLLDKAGLLKEYDVDMNYLNPIMMRNSYDKNGVSYSLPAAGHEFTDLVFVNDRWLFLPYLSFAIYRIPIRQDQTALWQNQSLGGAGTIKQINVKNNNKGTRNWYIKKSSDTTWTSFDPNTYYVDGIINCASFDLKVEMGNFYEPDKSQIEIEEVSVLYDDGKPARQIIPLF